MKILNLYAGIGGNRKLWGNEHQITAVELDPEIAKIYKDFFPDDEVIVGDAHQYLLEHYKEFDFIWASPPCPSHSRIRKFLGVDTRYQAKPIYPDMKLWQEIIFLQHHCKGKFCVENVIAYYEPLIKPLEMCKHWFWCNFNLPPMMTYGNRAHHADIEVLEERKGFDIPEGIKDRRLLLRNCVEPEVGKYILECAIAKIKTLGEF